MPKEFDEDQNTELQFVIKSGFHEIPNKLNLGEVDFYISLKKLERAGLVREIVGMYFSYHGERYIISNAFIKLMEFIKYNANSPIFSY